MTEILEKQSSLVLQRTVGTENGGFRQVVKDPQNEFKVIGVIRQGSVTERGQEKSVYHLYDVKGQLLATEADRSYLENKTTVDRQTEMRQTALEKYRGEDLKKARETQAKSKAENEKANPKARKPSTRSNTKKAELER